MEHERKESDHQWIRITSYFQKDDSPPMNGLELKCKQCGARFIHHNRSISDLSDALKQANISSVCSSGDIKKQNTDETKGSPKLTMMFCEGPSHDSPCPHGTKVCVHANETTYAHCKRMCCNTCCHPGCFCY